MGGFPCCQVKPLQPPSTPQSSPSSPPTSLSPLLTALRLKGLLSTCPAYIGSFSFYIYFSAQADIYSLFTPASRTFIWPISDKCQPKWIKIIFCHIILNLAFEKKVIRPIKQRFS